MTGVLQLHACWAPSRTTHGGFLTLHTDSVWIYGTSACWVKVSSPFANNLIRGRSVQRISRDVPEDGAWRQLGVYLRRQSSVDPIPSLSIPSGLFPAGKPADNKSYTRITPSGSSLASLPIYPTQYSFSGLPVVPSPRSSTSVQGSPLEFFFFQM
jgi:hypothetical protein